MSCLIRFYRNVKKKSISMYTPQTYFLNKFAFSTWKMSVRESGREANPLSGKTKSFVSLTSTISMLSTSLSSILTAWHFDFTMCHTVITPALRFLHTTYFQDKKTPPNTHQSMILPTELSLLCFKVWIGLVYESSEHSHDSDLQFPRIDMYVSGCNIGLKSWPHWNQW